MITKRGQPITGSPLQTRRPYVRSTPLTSRDAEEQILRSDIPAQLETLRAPAPTNPSYRSSSDLSGFAKQGLEYGGKGRPMSVREMRDPDFAAIGYDRGATKAKPGNPVISGFPTRGNKRVAGDGNQRLANKGIKLPGGIMRTNLDIFSPRVLREAGLSRL